MHIKINSNGKWLTLSPNVSGTDNVCVNMSEGVITADTFTSWNYV